MLTILWVFGVRVEPLVHLLLSEAGQATPSLIPKVLKQRVSRDLRKGQRRKAPPGQLRMAFATEGNLPRFWQPRFYDFNVWSKKKSAKSWSTCTPTP